jgi:cell division septal protein FtsQ
MNPFKASSTPRSQVLRQKRAQKTADYIESARQNIHSTPKEAADPHAFRPVMPPPPIFKPSPRVNQPASHPIPRRVHHMPPVTSRFGAQVAPPRKIEKSSVRKAYTMTLASTGTEVRLPIIAPIHIGWRLLSGFLTVLMLACIGFFLFSPYMKVSGMTIDGLQRLNTEEVAKDLGVSNKRIYTIDASALRKKLATDYPDLANVKIQVTLPAKVKLSVNERAPVLAWTYDGKTMWIDQDGFIFPVRGDAAPAITVQGAGAPPLVSKVSNDILQELSSEVQPVAAKTPEPEEIVSQMDGTVLAAINKLNGIMPPGTLLAYSDSDGLGWVDSNGWAVYIGLSTAKIDQQMVIYNAVVEELKKQGVTPSMISVEHVDAPFYR